MTPEEAKSILVENILIEKAAKAALVFLPYFSMLFDDFLIELPLHEEFVYYEKIWHENSVIERGIV